MTEKRTWLDEEADYEEHRRRRKDDDRDAERAEAELRDATDDDVGDELTVLATSDSEESAKPTTLEETRPKPKFTESDLSHDQARIYEEVMRWIDGKALKRGQLLTLGGYAGTGKTTVLSVLAQAIGEQVTFAAFTGRAVGVLRRKMLEAGVIAKCRTLHSLLYKPVEDKDGTVEFIPKSVDEFEEDDPGLIVIDESSMVPGPMYDLLKSFGHQILAVGDHGQLPPVGGSFNLMEKPMLRLEKIHRQAEGNPIIRLSATIRETGKLDLSLVDNKHVFAFQSQHTRNVITSMFRGIADHDLVERAILCYRNTTRNALNLQARWARANWERDPGRLPLDGEQVVCLKNTEEELGGVGAHAAGKGVPGGARRRSGTGAKIFNGQRGFFRAPVVDGNYVRATLEGEEFGAVGVAVRANRHQFGRPKRFDAYRDVEDATGGAWRPYSWLEVGQLFDFGYALTVHKFQGSQARDVLVVVERPYGVDDDTMRRWLYTAATRSSERLAFLV